MDPLIIALAAYLSYAISTSIDKYIMNNGNNIATTTMLRMFFDGVILFLVSIIVIGSELTFNDFMSSIIPGIILGAGAILYFLVLKNKDVSQSMPLTQASEILLIFLLSAIIFNESIKAENYLGVILIVASLHLILNNGSKIELPSNLIIALIIVNLFYWVMVKATLFLIKPLNLAIIAYFVASGIIFVYSKITNKKKETRKLELNIILISSVFGSAGTALLFYALSVEDATKIYPLAGLQSIFIYLIAIVMMKEKFYLHKLIGVVIAFVGIYLTQL